MMWMMVKRRRRRRRWSHKLPFVSTVSKEVNRREFEFSRLDARIYKFVPLWSFVVGASPPHPPRLSIPIRLPINATGTRSLGGIIRIDSFMCYFLRLGPPAGGGMASDSQQRGDKYFGNDNRLRKSELCTYFMADHRHRRRMAEGGRTVLIYMREGH